MAILSSFNTGISGLQAAGSSMSVIGDNISNAGTTGFKGSRAEFQDMLSMSLKGIEGGDQIGSGTKMAHVRGKFNQGAISRTETVTDLAINGVGFFAIEAPFGRGYTRDGSFQFDKEGNLTTGDGYKILGFQSDEKGKITNKIGAIKLGSTTIPATATKNVDFMMNLDSRSELKQFDAKKPEQTSNFNTGITVYDNVGTAHLATLYFNRTEDGAWDYHAMVEGAEATGGKPGEMMEMATGKLKFNDKGVLQEEVESKNSFNFNKGASQDQKITFNFGASIKEGGTGLDATTQYGSKCTVARHTQDGSSAASLASLSFNDAGVLTAVYNNGESRDISQIAVTRFENNEGLHKLGKNLFKESRKSGQGAMGKPGEDGRGDILSKSLELSNIDIADEFVNLMNAQRNFMANTRTITTADQMLQEVLNIKR